MTDQLPLIDPPDQAPRPPVAPRQPKPAEPTLKMRIEVTIAIEVPASMHPMDVPGSATVLNAALPRVRQEGATVLWVDGHRAPLEEDLGHQ